MTGVHVAELVASLTVAVSFTYLVVEAFWRGGRTIERAERECLTRRADRAYVEDCYRHGGWQ